MKKIGFTLMLCFLTLPFFAEDNLVLELGGNLGVAYYMGDANSIPFKNSDFAYGALLRFRVDNRFAAKAEFSRARIKGEKEGVSFKNDVNILDFCGEFNFFDFGRNDNLRFSHFFSPYIFAGLGVMNYSFEGDLGAFGLSVPFGLGLKVKVGRRVTFNLELSNRLLANDNLEGKIAFNNVKGLNGRNFMNNDLLSTLTVGVSIDIWKRKCDCIVRE